MNLLTKIKSREAKIAVIGLGYVGLPLAVEISKKFNVVGVERDEERVNLVNEGKSYIHDVPEKSLIRGVKNGRLGATQSYEALSDRDIIITCVPTPLDRNRVPVTKYIEEAVDSSLPYLKKGQLFILESTTYPGTTEEIVKPRIENKGFKIGKNFYLVFSPERIDPGNKEYNTSNLPKVVGGVTPRCAELAKAFYEEITSGGIFVVSSARVAEMEKLLENVFRIVNISLVNELAMLCDRMGIDIWEVIEAAKTKPYGFMPFYPGPGTGGHCIPLDPFYLSWKAKEYGFSTKFIELAGEINEAMPSYVVRKVMEILNKKGKCLKDSRILLLGVAYKRDVGDTRGSPAIKIAEMLRNFGVEIMYHDPFVRRVEIGGKLYTSVKLTPDVIEESDLVLIATNHSKVNYSLIVEKAKAIYDSRNALTKYNSTNIYKLGSLKTKNVF